MSRKNRAYGKQWLVKRGKWFIVKAWTHERVDTWNSLTRMVEFEVERFKSIEEYKKWRRKTRNESFWTYLKRNGITNDEL